LRATVGALNTDFMKKVMIFIDGSNYYNSLKISFNLTKIDIKKLVDFLVKDNNLVNIYYYSAPLNQIKFPEKYKKQQKYFAKLQNIKRLKLTLGRLEPRDGTMVEKGVDVNLAVDMVSCAYNDKFDIAILVSNDADFVPAVLEVQALAKQVYNVIFPKTKSYHLTKICDESIYIKDISDFLLSDK
jgi:uncharacterized LabA/DUF88 family protein